MCSQSTYTVLFESGDSHVQREPRHDWRQGRDQQHLAEEVGGCQDQPGQRHDGVPLTRADGHLPQGWGALYVLSLLVASDK